MQAYMNTAEASRFLGRTPKAIHKLVERGQLPHRRLGRRIIFVRAELEEFIEALPGMKTRDIQRRWKLL